MVFKASNDAGTTGGSRRCRDRADRSDINSAFELKEEVEAADIVAIVAPIHLQEQFLRIAGDRPVITALSERRLVPDGNGGETKVEFVFQKWERLVRIVVEKEDFVVS